MKRDEIIWALAHIQPATVQELKEFLDDDTSGTSTLTSVWRDGLVVRRRRPESDKRKAPYEYAISAPPDEE